MPALVTLGQLRAGAQRLSDTQNDPNVAPADWVALANTHVSDLWDRLVSAGPADYYASTTQITTVTGVIVYALPQDFRNLTAVFARGPSVDDRRAVLAMPEGTRASFKAPTDAVTLDVEYLPTAPTLVNDGDTIDGISGWAELVVNLMARDVMIKRESITQDVLNNIARLEARIVQRSRQRDRSPKRVVDLDEVTARRYPAPYNAGWSSSQRIACYRLRGDNLELYEPLWSIP